MHKIRRTNHNALSSIECYIATFKCSDAIVWDIDSLVHSMGNCALFPLWASSVFDNHTLPNEPIRLRECLHMYVWLNQRIHYLEFICSHFTSLKDSQTTVMYHHPNTTAVLHAAPGTYSPVSNLNSSALYLVKEGALWVFTETPLPLFAVTVQSSKTPPPLSSMTTPTHANSSKMRDRILRNAMKQKRSYHLPGYHKLCTAPALVLHQKRILHLPGTIQATEPHNVWINHLCVWSNAAFMEETSTLLHNNRIKNDTCCSTTSARIQESSDMEIQKSQGLCTVDSGRSLKVWKTTLLQGSKPIRKQQITGHVLSSGMECTQCTWEI